MTASLSVEQIDRQIRNYQRTYQRDIGELRKLRAGIVKYGKRRAPKEPASNQRTRGVAPNSTGLKAAILALLPKLPARFSIDDVGAGLKAKNFDFAGRNPKDAIHDSLYVMAREQQFIRRARGDGKLFEKLSPRE